MVAVYISLFFLGLAAIDPVGIAAMPVLLTQKRPYARALIFLSGSFASLMIMGILFAKGLGGVALRLKNDFTWLVPTIEAVAAAILFVIALVAYLHIKRGKTATEPSGRTLKWLKLNDWHLFLLGAILVAIQSLVDVVFVIAMIHLGQVTSSNFELTAGVLLYTVAALALQFLVVVTFRFTPENHRQRILKKIQSILNDYSYEAIVVVSLMLGCLLLVIDYV